MIVIRTQLSSQNDFGIAQMDAPRVSVEAKHQEEFGLCPWREPEADRMMFFPDSTSAREETLILSHEQHAIEQKLGRTLSGDYNAIRINRILKGSSPLGVVITRRVRGESGVIELVLAVGNAGEVIRAKLQRMREPDIAASFLRSEKFMGSFRGKSVNSLWNESMISSEIPPQAKRSASGIIDSAHTALVLLEVGSKK